MKILFVGMPFSIHTVRWIEQLKHTGWELHFFSSFPYAKIHGDLKNVLYHDQLYTVDFTNPNIKYKSVFRVEARANHRLIKKLVRIAYQKLRIEKTRELTLRALIEKINPDIVHSLETQHAGYLVSAAKGSSTKFPVWIHSNWGIDLHFFGQLEEHVPRIRQVLASVDVFIAEGERDIELSKKFGCQSEKFKIPSVGGGFKISSVRSLMIKPSKRNVILLKGTQDSVRRGLVGLRAVTRCHDILHLYTVIIFNCSEEVRISAEIYRKNLGLKFQIIDDVSHEEMIKLNKRARISISTNMSDGVPNTMLEAMLYGAFPIQSNTSCADEWINHGVNGFLVPPEDPDVIEGCIRAALTNDGLVEAAAEYNFEKMSKLISYEKVQRDVINMYSAASLIKG